MKNSPFAMFGTDKNLEKEGIIINYGDFRVTLARSGGANQEFNKLRTVLAKPYMRLIQAGTLPDEVSEELNRELYAKATIRNFEVKNEDGDWEQGIPSKSGEVLEFSVENLRQLFKDLPDLFGDLQSMSADHSQYLIEAKEEVKKD